MSIQPKKRAAGVDHKLISDDRLVADDRLISHKEAAFILGKTPKALYELCYKGRGPVRVYRNGRPRQYLLSEIKELMSLHLKKEGER